MAPTLPDDLIPESLKTLHRLAARGDGQSRCHALDRDGVKTDVARSVVTKQGFALLLFRDQLNHLTDVSKRLIERLPLRIAAGERGTLDDVHVVLIPLDNDGQRLTHASITYREPTGSHKTLFSNPWRPARRSFMRRRVSHLIRSPAVGAHRPLIEEP